MVMCQTQSALYVTTYSTLYRRNESAADCSRCLITYTMSVLFCYTDTASDTGVCVCVCVCVYVSECFLWDEV